MPAALNVDREAVRTLAVAVGVREAARQMDIPEATVQAWSARGEWFVNPVQPPTVIQPTTIATKPANALQNSMLRRRDKGKLYLSKYYVDASRKAAKTKGKLEVAPLVRHVAAIGTALWPEQTTPDISINILNSAGGMG